MQDGFYKSRPIAADIAGFIIAAFTNAGGSAPTDQVAAAADQTKPIAGLTDSVGAKASYGLVDVQMTLEGDIRFGGNVAAGDQLMAAADGSGRAIKATKPGAGVTHYVIGTAQSSGIADDIGKVLINPYALIG